MTGSGFGRAAAWLRRRVAAAGGPVRVVQSLPVGPGARLLVVEFGGAQLLVGQGRGGLVALGRSSLTVTPAKAGAHHRHADAMGPRLRGGDGEGAVA